MFYSHKLFPATIQQGAGWFIQPAILPKNTTFRGGVHGMGPWESTLLSWLPRREVKEYCISNFRWFFLILLSSSCLIPEKIRNNKKMSAWLWKKKCNCNSSISKISAWLRKWLLEEAALGENPVGHDLAGHPGQMVRMLKDMSEMFSDLCHWEWFGNKL